MTYVVTVDARIADGAPEMDELQRVGAIALLEKGFDTVEGIDGPDGVKVEVLDTIVAVYPGGALLKVFVEAPRVGARRGCGALAGGGTAGAFGTAVAVDRREVRGGTPPASRRGESGRGRRAAGSAG